ncbi:PAC2 family protein [Epidermidibacterium keratini]|uniref:PAC2 family protein n=1 Tax=Epidermidibacterium keratini TaxID=1891644 RepID=A0A7L4YT17_9ACTN|nr:PAC2 family protein [Epidermidibacterium keratini]QHC02064.1 PAC2 family protein [Epidermidibacterium keratini]
MIDDDFEADLTSPVLIAAFSGWNDAARAASGVVEHLELSWDARPLASMDPQDYYDFQVNRPTVSLIDGVIRRMEWPTTHVSVCRPPRSDRDVLFVRGPEPNFHWAAYCEDLLDVARQTGVEKVVLLGAMHMQTHYRSRVPVTGSAYDGPSATRFGAEHTRYEGPAGITAVLHDACVRAGLPAVSFWAGVPYYLPWDAWVPATLALLHRVEDVLDMPIPVGTLPEQADDARSRAQAAIEADPELSAHLEQIVEQPEDPLADASGDDLAEEFERYLRRRSDEADD